MKKKKKKKIQIRDVEKLRKKELENQKKHNFVVFSNNEEQ